MRFVVALFFVTLVGIVCAESHVVAADESATAAAVARLSNLKARIFRKSGKVVEIVLNQTKVTDDDLRLVAHLQHLVCERNWDGL